MVPPSTSAHICDLGPRPCDEDIMIVSLHLSCSESALPLLKRPGRLPLWQGLSERRLGCSPVVTGPRDPSQ